MRDLAETPDDGVSWAWDVAHELAQGGGLGLLVRAGDSDVTTGTTLFVASTDDEDRAMDVVRQDWRLRNFRANPVILDNHDPMRVSGHAVEVGVPGTGENAGKLMIRVKWDRDNPDPTIAAVGHQHLNGIRRAGSVGFRPGKRTERSKLPEDHAAHRKPVKVDSPWGAYEMSGWYFEQSELLEFSSATVPMNPAALQRSYLAALGSIPIDDVDGRLRTVAETVPRTVADALRAALDEPTFRRGVVELLFPDLLAAMHTSTEYRRLLRALAEIGHKSTETSFFEQVALLVSKEK